MLLRVLALLFLARAASTQGAEGKAAESVPPEVSKARSDLVREAAEIILEQKLQLRQLKDKHLKLAQKGQAAATKKGDLKLALAWESLSKELEAKNLARKATLEVGAELPENKAANIHDGIVETPIASQKYWFGGPRTQKPDWIRFVLAEPSVVTRVRICVPIGTQWYKNGHEPLDYDLIARTGRKIRDTISVRRGEHPKTSPNEDGLSQWITLEFKEPVKATEVELHVSKTSGANLAPAVFEMEIFGE